MKLLNGDCGKLLMVMALLYSPLPFGLRMSSQQNSQDLDQQERVSVAQKQSRHLQIAGAELVIRVNRLISILRSKVKRLLSMISSDKNTKLLLHELAHSFGFTGIQKVRKECIAFQSHMLPAVTLTKYRQRIGSRRAQRGYKWNRHQSQYT